MTCLGQEDLTDQARIAFDEVHYYLPTHEQAGWFYAFYAYWAGEQEAAITLSEELLSWASTPDEELQAAIFQNLVDGVMDHPLRTVERMAWSGLREANKPHPMDE